MRSGGIALTVAYGLVKDNVRHTGSVIALTEAQAAIDPSIRIVVDGKKGEKQGGISGRLSLCGSPSWHVVLIRKAVLQQWNT